MTNNVISDILFLHTAYLKSRWFLFIFIILVFILYFRLVRKLVFLYFNVNVYLKDIPCLNKVTLPYLTLPYEDKQNVHGIQTENMRKQLSEFVKDCHNDLYKVNLTSAIQPEDALPIDVHYHRACWRHAA